ncbi:hypothetical protein [Microbispora sp. GKU 823]|uniref:hypothetical protein n=1 Tax=Microbispora sp. GKU 823 TaxID=1652100 RepID=UPI0011808D18|nr:hypothetical protein [Microbispora sp. GKU 823]
MGIRKGMAAAALAVGAGVTVLPAAPAWAANSECTVQNFWTTCSTGNLSAVNGWIEVTTFESYIGNPLCDASEIRWKVVDATNGHVVGRGTGATNRWRISGLTNSYYGRLDNCPRMTIRIHNS